MKTEFKDLKTLADELMIHASQNGCDQMQININDNTEFSVEIRDGKVERLTEASSKGLAMKAIFNNQVATASSSDLDFDSLKKLLANTIERAKLASKDPFAVLPSREFDIKTSEELKIYDPEIANITPETKINIAKEIERIAMLEKKINLSLGSSFSTTFGESYVAHSNSFNKSYKYSYCSAGVGLQCGSGNNMFEDGWYETAPTFKDFMSSEEIAKKAVERTIRMIGAKKISTQNVPIVMEPAMTSRLLGMLSQSVNGNAIYMNQSALVDKLGKEIASKNIAVFDDGTIPGALGTRPFDSEGVASRKTPVITNGILRNYLLSSYSAKKLNLESTGNASGPSNFYLANGSFKPEDIIKSVEKGLLLTKTIGQGFVPTTGDLSTGAYGIWIENGQLTYPVAEVTISGNLLKMLKDIVMVGNDLKFNRAVTGPTIKISEMTIAGK